MGNPCRLKPWNFLHQQKSLLQNPISSGRHLNFNFPLHDHLPSLHFRSHDITTTNQALTQVKDGIDTQTTPKHTGQNKHADQASRHHQEPPATATMDFAALMSKEIAKKKGPSPSSAPTTSSSKNDTSSTPSTPSTTTTTTTTTKFIRKADAEAARREAYLAEQARLEEDRRARAAAKRKREEDAAEEAKAREEKRRRLAEESRRRREEREAEEERARRKRLGLPELPPGSEDADGKQDGEEDQLEDGEDDISALDDDEITTRLRGLGEPATLFGEARAARARRLRRLTTAVTKGPIPTTLQLVEEKDMKVDERIPPSSDKAARRWLFRQLASYFTMILREWELALAREHGPEAGAASTAARQAYSTMVQCRQTMTPLFRKFEKGDLDDSVLKAVVEIVRAAQERRYVDANDGYLRLSIGKAAWPIGVTMVGIHERSAREKLHNGERGHVMGDEVTRKYLQSIKRCLTFAQVRWPPEDVRQLMG